MALVLMLPILMGVYVYRDAKARRMDAVLWTLVVVLVPSFIGLIIYLVIRGNNTNLNCPNCSQPVSADYALCPHCGARMKTACPACGTPAESGWKLCPKCGTALPETPNDSYVPAQPRRDRKLLGIIAAAVLIPILLFVVGAIGMRTSHSGHASLSYGTNLKVEDASANVREWIAACDAKGKGVYVLEPDDQGEDVYEAYIYINQYKDENGGHGYWGEAEVVRALLSRSQVVAVRYGITTGNAPEKVPDYELAQIRTQGYDIEGLRILVDGVEVEAVVTE
jgi:hypothetical protein